jgi:hypothetical protein
LATFAVTDHQSIQKTVQQMADGKLTLEQATERLLAGDWADVDPTETVQRETEFESLADLIQRLGDPPADIIENWCQQLSTLLKSSPPPIQNFDAADFYVTSEGRLCFRDGLPSPTTGSSFAAVDIERIVNAFRHQFLATQKLPDPQPTVAPVSASSFRSHWIIAAGIVLCAGAIFWIVRSNSTTTVAETDAATGQSLARGTKASGNVFAQFPSTQDRRSSADDESFDTEVQLETLQSLEEISDEEISLMEATSPPRFSLESLVPHVSGPDLVGSSDSPVENQRSGDAGDPSSNAGAEIGTTTMQIAGEPDPKVLSDDSLDSKEPDEIEQRTNQVVSAAVTLPPVDQTDPIVIHNQFNREPSPTELSLAFPYDVEVTIKPSGDLWTIIDGRSTDTIATLGQTDDDLTFAWTDRAASAPGSRSLHHGRLTTNDVSSFYLRPSIESDPWPIRLDQPDMRPTWDLQSPLPPSVTRLSVDFGLPEELEMTWVEPIPIDSPRRARGLAIMKPLDGESVDLAVKFDIRCSRKLSCRLRYAARLDSSMPWQLVSRPLLDQFSNQLATQAELVSREADRLQSVYEMAGTRGKRIIRIKQKHNDDLAATLRQFADRVAELQSLIAAVESNATLQFRVWIQWPESQQTVFSSLSSLE